MDRDNNGKFVEGYKGGPGRPKKAVEDRYLKKLNSSVSLADWQEIVKRAVSDAKRGDARARKWLSDYLIGVPSQHIELTGADGGAIEVDDARESIQRKLAAISTASGEG